MSNLNFFKGESSKFPAEDKREPYSFYLVEDTNDFYYTDKYNQLIKLATNPSKIIKEIHTYYSTTTKEPPTVYPVPADSGWSSTRPTYQEGDQIYSVSCVIYMSDEYAFSKKVSELITWDEIDEICEVPSQQPTIT